MKGGKDRSWETGGYYDNPYGSNDGFYQGGWNRGDEKGLGFFQTRLDIRSKKEALTSDCIPSTVVNYNKLSCGEIEYNRMWALELEKSELESNFYDLPVV